MKGEETIPVLKKVRRSSNGWTACCPAHDDHKPSLSVTVTNDPRNDLFNCHAGCNYKEIMEALEPLIGSADAKRWEAPPPRPRGTNTPVAEYNYFDESDRLLYQIVRYEERAEDGVLTKIFRARRRPRSNETPASDGWIYKLDGTPLELFNVGAISAASLVYVVEGEKDVVTLCDLDLAAVCNPFGAGKWHGEFSEKLRGKTVAILPDNDESGQKHAEAVAASLVGIATEVLVIQLPGLPPKGDVTDFINAGGTADDLMDLVQRAQPSKSSTIPQPVRAPGFTFTTLSQLLGEPEESVAFVWERTLPTGGFSICSAKPKVGKSTFARNLAKAVDRGEAFLGRLTKPGRVLYLCLEEKRSEVANHFRRMGADSVRILIHTGATPANALEQLAHAIAEYSPELVVIDPLSRILRVGDYNEYGGMSRGLEPFIDLARRSGCHILALHHDSKMDRNGGDALLGSTAIFASVDCHIQLAIRDGRRTIQTTQRYGEDLPPTVIALDKETGIISVSGTLAELKTDKVKSAILDSIEIGEDLPQREIKDRNPKIAGGELSRGLGELVAEGKLVKTGSGKRGDPFKYAKQS